MEHRCEARWMVVRYRVFRLSANRRRKVRDVHLKRKEVVHCLFMISIPALTGGTRII